MTSGEIEVGAADTTLQLWLVAEAVRQGEMILAAQTANLAALETRATSILAWCAATLVAVAAAASQGPLLPLAAGSGLFLSASALLCALALWPKSWHGAGWTAAEMVSQPHETELEYRESFAEGYQRQIVANRRITRTFVVRLKLAWLCFLLAAPAGILSAILVSAV